MPITTPPPPTSRLGQFKGFLGVFVPLCLVLAIVGSMHYWTFYTAERTAREASESLNVDLARRMIETSIAAITSDLMFLAEHIRTQGLLDGMTPRKRRKIAEVFSVFADKKGLYDQIRFLDENGMEVVRVNYNDGTPRAVLEEALQNKSNRYYFREAMALDEGGIYLSPLDLNVEEGKIEYPLKPMIRFGTPVFDNSDNKQGIILLNHFGIRLIEDFTRAAANIADHIELLNHQGYWLSNPRHEDEWGFMFGLETRLQNQAPFTWQQITQQQSGQFQTKDGLFTFSTVYPLLAALEQANPGHQRTGVKSAQQPFWKIVSRVSPQELSATLPLFIQKHLALYLTMFGLITLGAWLLSQSRLHHRAMEAQRDYERRFRHTLENIELAAVGLNLRGEVTFCNDFFLNMTGWQRAEVVGRNWLDHFVSDEFKPEVAAIIGRMTSPEQFPSHFENQVRTRDGDLRLIAWNNTLSYDTEGEVIGVTGIGEDITDKRRTELELHKLYQAVEQSPSIVLITNRAGLIDYVNPKFSEVTGYAFNEVVGKNPRFLKSGETTQTEYSQLWNTLLSGGEWRGEFHNRRKNGELYWESASLSAIRNPQGEITNFLAVKEDITERKRLEAEVEERNRELARSQALAAMGRMASMIAHDLRNPLSSVKMTLQILGKQLDGIEHEEANELTHISLEQIRYMEEILSDMLTYAQPDAIKPEWITIDKVLDMAISLTQQRLDQYQVRLATHYNPGVPTLFGDATKLRQVFSNLIANAIQANETSDDAQIVIDTMTELGPDGTSIQVEICDNGPGIEPEDAEKVFEPFFTTRSKGTGLGLAIVKRVLDQHRATIEIIPHLPNGTCVVVVLPVSPRQTQTSIMPPVESINP